MKAVKKILALLLTVAMMTMALGVTAFADEDTPTGSITIKSTEKVSVAGKTFNAYKILDVEVKSGTLSTSYVYTVPSELEAFYVEYFNTLYKNEEGYTEIAAGDANFDYEVTELIRDLNDDELSAFATAALAAAKEVKITPSTATAEAGATSVTISNLPLGYYVVEDAVVEDAGTATPISALILDTTTPNAEIQIKADKPTVDKNIDGDKDTDDSTTGDVKYNTAAIGDKVPYKVTSAVPDMTGYTKYYFVMNDTLSKGLTFNKDVVITIGEKTLTANTDYTVTTTPNDDGTTSVKIVFKDFIQYKDQVGAAITITYSATVNENAVIGTVGNENKVKITYSNDPNTTDEGEGDEPTSDSPVGETPESETRTYVTDIELIKVDENGNRLTGAEFQIAGIKLNTVVVSTDVYTESDDGDYWKLKDGSYTTTEPTDDTSASYEDPNVKYTKTVKTEVVTKKEDVTYTGTVGADGVLRFEGLSAGEYTITEIKAPDGYNLLKDSITVTIKCTMPGETSTITDCTWTYAWTYDGNDPDKVDTATNSNVLRVINQYGSELPETGGIGTTIFYVLGGILVVGAGVLLITKRRMNNQK